MRTLTQIVVRPLRVKAIPCLLALFRSIMKTCISGREISALMADLSELTACSTSKNRLCGGSILSSLFGPGFTGCGGPVRHYK